MAEVEQSWEGRTKEKTSKREKVKKQVNINDKRKSQEGGLKGVNNISKTKPRKERKRERYTEG